MNKRITTLTLSGVLLLGCLTGCGAAAALDGNGKNTPEPPLSQAQATEQQATDTSSPILSAIANDSAGDADEAANLEERFKIYEQFGMIYNASKNELQYNGKTVRWFEDYYPVADGSQAGIDFFNENGAVDVYAVRDLSSFVYAEDGSFDPSGKLTGLKEFSDAEFAARDIEAIKNPPSSVTIAGNPPSIKELEDRAKEYEAFGVTYDVKIDQWYFNGEKVRIFQDVLTSNGESLSGGNFHGVIRTMGGTDGTIDIYTVRDFTNPDANGYGTLTGVEKFSQEEFDEHTRREEQSSSGFCTVE